MRRASGFWRTSRSTAATRCCATFSSARMGAAETRCPCPALRRNRAIPPRTGGRSVSRSARYNMQAVVKYGTGDGEVELREVPPPEIGPTDVLLETAAAGVCGSDVEQWRHHVTYHVN